MLLPKHRPPTHPGRFLAENLEELGITQSALAERIGVPFQRVNLIVNGRRGVTPDTALRLSKLFSTTPDFWLNAQTAWDLWHAQREAEGVMRRIRPLKPEIAAVAAAPPPFAHAAKRISMRFAARTAGRRRDAPTGRRRSPKR
jgi:addiction module HigA family antidote